MPWKVIDVVNERMRFVLRLEDGERMSELCREFGISRKTGYKIYSRFQDLGPAGLYDESRAPKRQWQQTPPEIEDLIVKLRKRHVTWGPDLQDVGSAARGQESVAAEKLWTWRFSKRRFELVAKKN